MDQELFQVLINEEEQYSLWPESVDVPDGWRTVGVSGTREVCLEYVDKTWTDMRPASLRREMAELARNLPPPTPHMAESLEPPLVERLSVGRHPVVVKMRRAGDLAGFRDCLGRRFVLITFTGTQGSTELGIRVNPKDIDASGADFETGRGEVKLAGALTLDFQPAICHATIRLPDLSGEGHLVPVDDQSPAQP